LARGVRHAARQWLHERSRRVRHQPPGGAIARRDPHLHAHGRAVGLRRAAPVRGVDVTAMKGRFVPFLLGVVFALGLGISGMTDPRKIIAFLNVAGAWDPSLAFVMIGAVAVHFGFAQWALRAKKPAWAPAFFLATKTTIGAPLVTGAAIFGLGWGAAGYCPGPAVVATGALELTGAHGHSITQARSLVMHSFTGLILVALTTAGCSATYAYVPATNAPLTTLYGHAAADYAIPPQAPRGDLRVASYGIEPLSPEGADDESVGALHIRLSIANKSDQPWTLDTREQQAALEGRATSTPAFAARSPGVGSPPIVTIAPNSTRLVDVFFPLPEDMQSASAVPALRFTSTVHTDAGPVSETTP